MKKNIKSNIVVVTLCFVFSTIIGYARTVSAAPIFTSTSDLSSIISSVLGVLSNLVPIIIGAAVVFFLFGVFKFITKTSSGDAEGHKEGINFMIWGIVGIAVMVSVWGLVAFVTNTFGVSSGTGFVPQLNTSNGAGTSGGQPFITGPDLSGGNNNLGSPMSPN